MTPRQGWKNPERKFGQVSCSAAALRGRRLAVGDHHAAWGFPHGV